MPVRAEQHVSVSAQAGTPVTTLPWIPLNPKVESFSLTYVADKYGSGQLNYKIQGTLDNINDSTVSANTFDIVTSAATHADGTYSGALMAIRVQVVSASASSDLAFRVLQTGH